MRRLLLPILAIILLACDPSRVYEDNTDLAGQLWTQDQVVAFRFQIQDPNSSYNIYSNIRNAIDYPYYNLYYQYTLQDSSGKVLTKKLQNIDLFDPKTGEPYGSGLGDLFDHQQLILEDYEFDLSGEYIVSFQQYMRRDTLPLILSVGARVERSDL